MTKIPFDKMHGCGNDFVVIDIRNDNRCLDPQFIKDICNRRMGIGCDQLIVLSSSKFQDCQAHYQFFNPDASEAEQCGNGQRCIAKYLHRSNPKLFQFKVSGLAGIIHSQILDNELIKINIGHAKSVSAVMMDNHKLIDVQLANPHLVMQVKDITESHLAQIKDSLKLSEDVNFEIVEILNKSEINLRVHERGTGETLACGSGACAAVLAFQMTNQLSEQVKVHLPGGDLVVEYHPNQNEIYLTGPATFVFNGEYKYDK